MITKDSIDKIFDTADIVEVISEFVTLKKRGVNYVGLSPFNTEKTPSFVVSPVKQIFKDFSSGKGGSVVTFLMEHEKFSYPEALRWLAVKYNIEIEEDKIQENSSQNDERESLFILNEYAKSFFASNIFDTEEGKNIGQGYFTERGFTTDTLKKFNLGYSIDSWDNFTKTALAKGYKEEYLAQLGLSIKREDQSLIDRYKGRVIFPIHNLSGRVIGFAGRALKNLERTAKYLNSPESIIYHKSDTLYGIFFAKNKIREENNAFLVEGYTDVISLHQAGIENVVASSGTSLTAGQIQLIKRFTQNVTILYDGDAAGIKASLRSIDMLLEENLNVKIVLFPDGHDPDSFMRNVGEKRFREYIKEKQQDFILFKTSILLKDINNDPIKRSEVIHDIVASIAKIPDSIKADIYISETSRLLQIKEDTLRSELNKKRLNNRKKTTEESKPVIISIETTEEAASIDTEEYQEREIIRILLRYGNEIWEGEQTIAQFVINELSDDINFTHNVYSAIFEEIKQNITTGILFDEQIFIRHKDSKICSFTVDLMTDKYIISKNWEKHDVYIPTEFEHNKREMVLKPTLHLKLRKVEKMIYKIIEELKKSNSYEDSHLLDLLELRKLLSQELGTSVTK